MIPFRAFDLNISNHCVQRYIERMGLSQKDEFLIRPKIKKYFLDINENDIYETKEGTYYVRYYHDIDFDSHGSKDNRDFYFVVSKDSTVMTFSQISTDKLLRNLR